MPPKPGRVADAKPPYMPKPTKVTPKPTYATKSTYATQAYARPTMRQTFMRPVYRPPVPTPKYNVK